MPADRTRTDACPGAIDVHPAADGGLARVRVPGGTLTNAQFRAVCAASVDLGDGQLELTSRANLQIRGLADGAQFDLAERVREVGLLPSLTHERVRNIIAAPLADNQDLVDRIDHALCAVPALAELPGRFLITVGVELGGDIGLVDDALLLAGQDTGLRPADPVAAVVQAAELFLALRDTAWRLAEVPDGVARITAALGSPTAEPISVERAAPPLPGPHGERFVVGAPLGSLTADQAQALADLGTSVRLTPWRSLVLPGVPDLTGLGLITEPDSPWHGVTACAGRPGCAKSLADVRVDARAWLGTPHSRPVHWVGCERRCGRPTGDVIEFVATGDGYEEFR